jgi:hypothetical protein
MSIVDTSILRSRLASFVIVLVSAYVTPQCWMKALHHQQNNPRVDIVLICGLCWAIFVSAAIATRSSFLGDRFTFGFIAGAFAANVVAKLTPNVNVAHSLALYIVSVGWSAAGVISLYCLLTQHSAPHPEGQRDPVGRDDKA